MDLRETSSYLAYSASDVEVTLSPGNANASTEKELQVYLQCPEVESTIYVQVPLLSSTLGNGSIINDLDISVGHSKSQRQCTLHPISKYVFYTALSTSVELFVFCFFGF